MSSNAIESAPRRRLDAPRKRRRRREASLRIVMPILAVGLLLCAWQAWIVIWDVEPYLMPAVPDVAKSMVTEFVPLLPDTWVTLQEIFLGFLMSVAVGIPIAILLVSSRLFEMAIYPLLVIAQVLPKVAIAPLVIVWIGFGIESKVLIAFLIAFFPIVIDTVVGLRSTELEKLYLARSMGASRFQTFFKIRLPGALPSIFSGLKLSITFAVIGAVVGEFVASDAGLGRVIMSASASYDTVLMFTGVGYLTIIGLVLFFAMDYAERLLLPWHVSRRVERMTGGT
jgi:NitT/TauT family transport system permease protein